MNAMTASIATNVAASRLASLAIPALLFLSACQSPGEGAPGAEHDAAPPTQNTAVSIMTMKAQAFSHYFTVSGNVQTDRNARIFPKTQGVVERVLVKEGDRVRAGAGLIDLDNEALVKNRTEIASRLGLAIEVLERKERLWADGIGSEIGIIEARSNVAALTGSLSAFDETVNAGDVTAPFDGVVERIFVVQGEMANPMMPVARIVDLENMYVRASVSDYYVGQIHKGQHVEIVASGTDTIPARVGRVGQYIEPANRTFEVVIPLNNAGHLLPNQYVSVWVNDLALDSALTLPSGALLQDGSGADFVFLVRENNGQLTAHKQMISTGASQGSQILITSGLKPNDRVILRGAHKLTDGEAVSLIH